MNPIGNMATTQTNATRGEAALGAGQLPGVPVVLASRPASPPVTNLLESLYDAVMLTDLAGSVRQCNQRAVELMGYAHAELCGRLVGHFVVGLTPELLQTIDQHLSAGRFSVLEGRCTRKNGSQFPAEIAVSAVALEEGRGFCFALRNITPRREMQNRLRLAQNALQSSASAVVMADLKAKLQYANPAFCRMWAVAKPEDVLGKSMEELFGAANAALLCATLQTGAPWIGELSFPRQGAADLHVQATSAPNIDHQNVTVGMVLSFIDISQRKLAEEKIRREVETQLQRAREQKDFSGQLNIITLPELIQFVDTSGKSGRLEVLRAEGGALATLDFEVGRVVFAACGDLRGEAAFYELLRLGGHSFTFRQDVELGKDPALTKTTMGLLLEGLRHLDEAASAATTPVG
jgi:PAS domain S-box-containing protein